MKTILLGFKKREKMQASKRQPQKQYNQDANLSGWQEEENGKEKRRKKKEEEKKKPCNLS